MMQSLIQISVRPLAVLFFTLIGFQSVSASSRYEVFSEMQDALNILIQNKNDLELGGSRGCSLNKATYKLQDVLESLEYVGASYKVTKAVETAIEKLQSDCLSYEESIDEAIDCLIVAFKNFAQQAFSPTTATKKLLLIADNLNDAGLFKELASLVKTALKIHHLNAHCPILHKVLDCILDLAKDYNLSDCHKTSKIEELIQKALHRL